MRGDEIDTSRIAYEDHFFGELLGFEMEMKDRAVGVDDELRVRKYCLCHGCQGFKDTITTVY